MRWLAMFCFSAAGAILALQYAPRWAVGVVAIAAAAVLLFGLRRPKPKRTAALLLACGILLACVLLHKCLRFHDIALIAASLGASLFIINCFA